MVRRSERLTAEVAAQRGDQPPAGRPARATRSSRRRAVVNREARCRIDLHFGIEPKRFLGDLLIFGIIAASAN